MGRLQSVFSSHQIDVLIGSLLGDARLECRSAGVHTPVTARFRVHHGVKQKEYVFWKYEVLKNFVSKQPREISWTNPKRNLYEVFCYFHTRSVKELGILHQYFYHQKIKILPEDIFEILTPCMIAVWFMDDGSHNGGSLTLNTHSFSIEDQERVVEYFRIKFKINAKIVKDRTKWKIAIGQYDMLSFLSIIEPYIIPSMIYKIGNPRNDFALYAQDYLSIADGKTSVPNLGNLEKV